MRKKRKFLAKLDLCNLKVIVIVKIGGREFFFLQNVIFAFNRCQAEYFFVLTPLQFVSSLIAG